MALPDGISDILPLSPAQQGMLFHIIENEETRARYVAVISVRISGALDAARLKTAIADTVQAHDALRAGFVYGGVKAPVQAIRDHVELPFTQEDWSAEAQAEAKLDALFEAEQRRRFKLTKPPLMALTLVRLAPDAHVLVWTVQHIISDGWSLSVMLDEVFARYHGGQPAPAGRFRDYLVWLKKQEPAASDTFWRSYLDGCSASLLDLATDDPDSPDIAGEHVIRAQIPAALMDRAETLTARLRITQNALLSSIWALVLRKITGADDVVFGATSAGRPAQIPGIDRAVGAFVNTLPVREIIDPSKPCDAFLTEAAARLRARGPHEFAALSHVQTLAQVPPGTALFDTLFVHQGLPPAQQSYDEISIAPPEIRQSSHYALAMLARPENGLTLELIHDRSRVASYAAQGVMDLYCDLLRAAVEHPETPLGALLPPAPAPDPVPPFDDVVTRFVAHATRDPDAIAVTDTQGGVSYGALLAQAQSVAGALTHAGLQLDELVPVALPRSSTCIAAYLGVMLAGGAYVPVDLDYPEDRISQILTAVSPRFVLAYEGTSLPVDAHIIDPDAASASEATPPKQGSLAYVMFTSGSQGQPKGVQITRAGLAYSTGVRAQVFDHAPGCFLLLSSLAFDSSVVGVFWSLAEGGHLVISPPRAEQNPTALGAMIQRHAVSHTLCLPGLYDALLSTVSKDALDSLRLVIVAGEAPSSELAAKHRATLPQAQLFNEYGPTEGTVWCAAFNATDHAQGPIPIGAPPPGTALPPCDPDGAPLPAGLPGEMILTGPAVARGYFNAPEQTATRFSNGAFKTGDLGRRLPSGALVFLGRNDAQVKIRGHRIELGDVEAAASHGDPAMTCAAVAPNAGGTRRIVLFVMADAVDPGLRSTLAKRLPSYALPSEIRAVASFPMLPNGKIDRAALERLGTQTTRTESAAPQGELEIILAGLWRDVLGRADVARGDNFFDIGGDSLKSIALFAKAEALGLTLQPTDIFDHQTIAELARHMSDRHSDQVRQGEVSAYNIANPDGDQTPIFLLHANMRVFRSLVNGFGKGHPAALQFSHHFKGMEAPKAPTIEGLAKDALARLRALKPHGPYIICGYSAGAFVALELAQMLRAQGEEVPLLSLIDPPYDASLDKTAHREKLRETARTVYYALGKRLGKNEKSRHAAQVNAAYVKAVSAYKLRPYEGYCHVQVTPQNLAMDPGSALPGMLPNIGINRLDCTHNELLSDPAYALATASRIIAEFRARGGA